MNAIALFLAACMADGTVAAYFELPVCTADLERFPPAPAVDNYLELNSAHRDWLCKKPRFCWPEDRSYWRWRCADAFERWEIWDGLRLAHAGGYERDDHGRLYWLHWLRERIGADAYYAGVMPCPVYIEGFWIIGY